jgi:hypothetical protein
MTAHPFAAAARLHPVVIETVETRLVWVDADTAEQAAQRAAALIGSPVHTCAPLVDSSVEARAVTEALADFLDADPHQVERLDDYFAARG